MTAHILRLPLPEAAFARLTAIQREANIADEAISAARLVLRAPGSFDGQIIRDACAVLQTYGDGTDYLTAEAMIFALNRREWQARNLPQETPAAVARKFAHRWPSILGFGAVWAAIMLALSGWVGV